MNYFETPLSVCSAFPSKKQISAAGIIRNAVLLAESVTTPKSRNSRVIK